MDIKTSCQILLGVLLASFAFSILGLAADNISYINNHQHPSPVGIHYIRWNETAHGQYSYWVTIDYLPSRFSMSTTNATLAASIICGIVGVAVAVASWVMPGNAKKGPESTSSSKKKHFLGFLPLTMILTTITFLTTLALSIYIWQPTMQWSINFEKSLPLPLPNPAGTTPKPLTYQSPFDFTPEIWNCQLFPYVVDPAQGQRLQRLCREAGIAKYLMIPLLVLSAGMIFCVVWSWRSERVATAAAANAENEGGKDVEEISVQNKE